MLPARPGLEGHADALPHEWCVLGSSALGGLDLPKSVPLLGPILSTRAITLLRGPSGAGKSLLALSLAHAVAGGGTLFGWAARPACVLYVDAGLPLATLQARMALLDGSGPYAKPGALSFLATDAQAAGPIDLGTALGRAALTRHLDGIDLLVLDDLSTLVPSARVEHWQPVAAWFAALRRQGLAVLLVDTWRRRRRNALLTGLLDAALAISHPHDWDTEDGARLHVRLWARGMAGPALRPFEARLQPTAQPPWTRIDALDADALQVWRLTAQGFPVRKIATRLQFSISATYRLLKRARQLDPTLRAQCCIMGETSGTGETAETGGTPGTA